LNALPAVNLTVFVAGMVMLSPVEGLRPARSARAPNRKRAESHLLDCLAADDGHRHSLENGMDGFGRAGLAPACGSRNGINQFVPVHL
jgi:hypothetical protein